MRYQYLKGEDYFGVSESCDTAASSVLLTVGNAFDQGRIVINSPQEMKRFVSELLHAAERAWPDIWWSLISVETKCTS